MWYDMIWYDMIWYDMIWYDMIFAVFNDNCITGGMRCGSFFLSTTRALDPVASGFIVVRRVTMEMSWWEIVEVISNGWVPSMCIVVERACVADMCGFWERWNGNVWHCCCSNICMHRGRAEVIYHTKSSKQVNKKNNDNYITHAVVLDS
jgi:hypothetical protein